MSIDRPLTNATQFCTDRLTAVSGLSKFKLQQLTALVAVVLAWWGVLTPPVMREVGFFIIAFTVLMLIAASHAAREEHHFSQKYYVHDVFWQNDDETRLIGVAILIGIGVGIWVFASTVRHPFVYVCACLIAHIYIAGSVPRHRESYRHLTNK